MDVELDGAMPVNEDELARARGVLRNALVGLKERDDRAPGAQWIDRFKPSGDRALRDERRRRRRVASVVGRVDATRGASKRG